MKLRPSINWPDVPALLAAMWAGVVLCGAVLLTVQAYGCKARSDDNYEQPSAPVEVLELEPLGSKVLAGIKYTRVYALTYEGATYLVACHDQGLAIVRHEPPPPTN